MKFTRSLYCYRLSLQHIKLWVGILLTMAQFFNPFMGIVIVDSFEALSLEEQRFERTDAYPISEREIQKLR